MTQRRGTAGVVRSLLVSTDQLAVPLNVVVA
jgi:hypothetical protein